ncbi:restriction endonuclease [Nostoc sp. FACHB-110]|uniref:restriction endonuclease n=1 Tax=Nostoc sp. FACHB-110 TaxID=2692834 RepID=UPI00168623F7|nr:restriction endonuclease [Nostoc sp. FACHB-110]MBD2440568.1 restriction endonuclease [Nostoc sp. FACHB-110]
MEIIIFLSGLACIILLIWLSQFFFSSPPEQKTRQKVEYREGEPRTLEPPKPSEPPLKEVTPSPQSSTLTPVPLKELQYFYDQHHKNIERANSILQELRNQSIKPKLPLVIGTLRQTTPYVFEELLLSCCLDQGWEIRRNTNYSNDGGVDGRVLIRGKLYLIQAKRYTDHIKSEHLHDFQEVIEAQRADGGFFIHSGKTGPLSKTVLKQYPQIVLISGQRLVNFVLGKKLKIVGINV